MALRRGAGVLVCLTTALLAGCSSAQQASTSLPTSSAPAAASSTALPPLGPADFPMPPEARQKTPEGVTAFTRYYLDLINRSNRTLDSSPLRSLSRNCATCAHLADEWDQAKSAEQRIDGGSVSLLSTGGVLMTAEGAEIATHMEQSPLTLRNANGDAITGRSSAAANLTGGLKLAWDGSRSTWVVTQFDADPV